MSLDTSFLCPSCRKKHQIDSAQQVSASCSRCDCDLEMLIAIRISASAMLAQARQALRSMDGISASQYAESAWGLIHWKEIAECGMIASILTQDQSEIGIWLRRIKNDDESVS